MAFPTARAPTAAPGRRPPGGSTPIGGWCSASTGSAARFASVPAAASCKAPAAAEIRTSAGRRTAVLSKIPHSNCCKKSAKSASTTPQGRFGTLLEQLECGLFERTAVCIAVCPILVDAKRFVGVSTNCTFQNCMSVSVQDAHASQYQARLIGSKSVSAVFFRIFS